MAVIEFKNVTKEYKLFKGEGERLKFLFNRKTKVRTKVALKNVSFSIEQGESVAIMGRNGAGKTTTLKLIDGVSYPTEGEVIVNGRVNAILELSAGFDPEFTGRENIRFRGQLFGLKNEEIAKLEPKIVEFAELGEYIDQPVRTYTSGMKSKLGFAINVNLKPRIVIVDEALSVGDGAFKRKCLEKMQEITSHDKVTFIFTTHSPKTASQFCQRGIILKNGRVIFDGPMEEAEKFYRNPILPDDMEEE